MPEPFPAVARNHREQSWWDVGLGAGRWDDLHRRVDEIPVLPLVLPDAVSGRSAVHERLRLADVRLAWGGLDHGIADAIDLAPAAEVLRDAVERCTQDAGRSAA